MMAWSEVVRGIKPRLNVRPTTVVPARTPACSGTPRVDRADSNRPN